MAYGANYSVNPEIYSEVAAFSTRNTSIPSGASIVHGIYYMWNENGFTGNGWKYDIKGGLLICILILAVTKTLQPMLQIMGI